MSNLLHVSTSPHIRVPETTTTIMLDVLVALVPSAVFGVYIYGLSALWIILVSVFSCVLTEYVYEKLMKLPVTIQDCSSIVTGVLLAFCLPASVPIWLPAIGGVFAILVVKQVFGGIGQNFMNPALAARCFLLISFGQRLTQYPAVRFADVDMVSQATPLADLKATGSFDLLNMFLGVHKGCIGETSIVCLLVGAVYLLLRRIISWRIPFVYIGSTLLFIEFFSLCKGIGFVGADVLLAHVCGGGLFLGAFFMATDYVTSPITSGGKIIYGLCLGFMTAAFRIVGKSAEGVSYAIIICNLLVPLIEKITVPKAFGLKGGDKE